ncbi:MAG: YihY/virulence factor BrkB family protein, partial [Firmicutes bacterium]|nr:YihY/virulence factor BrkB family protein [Bacillota bacterium]
MIRLIFSVYLRRLRQDEISTYAAQIAFFSILSIVPFLMLLSMWLSNLGTLNWEGLLVVLEESGTLPPSGLKMLRQILSSLNGSVGLFSLSALMVFWSSSRMIRALMTGMHMVYRERDKRSLLLRYLLSILYTILLSIAIVLMLVMSIFGRKILELLGSSPFLELVWGVLRLVVPVLVLLLIFWSLFLVLPTQRVSLLDALPGAVFSTITLLVVSQIFSFYVNLRDTSFLYGGLSGFVAILFWFYQFG